MGLLGTIGGVAGSILGMDMPRRDTNSNSFGFDVSQSSGGSSSNSSSWSYAVQHPDKVWGSQAGYLKDLYAQAAEFLPQSNELGQQMFQRGMGVLDQMFQPGANPYLDVYAQEVQRNLENNILPTIGAGGIQAGQFGASRDTVARGQAATIANQQVVDMAAQLYDAQMSRALNAVQTLPSMMGLPWFGMSQMAGILGNPVVLDQGGYSQSESSSSSSSSHSSSSFGMNQSQTTGGGGGGSIFGNLLGKIF